MTRAEHRVTVALHVHGRAAGPPREVQRQLFARAVEARTVDGAQGGCFRRRFDQVIEPVDERANAGFTAECLERGDGGNRRWRERLVENYSSTNTRATSTVP